MGKRIALPTDPPKRKRVPKDDGVFRDKAWLIELRDHPCIFTGLRPTIGESVVPMHIGTYGKGIKAPDNEILPAIASFHQLGHSVGEITNIRTRAPDSLIRDAFRAYAREYHAKHRGK